ncbi:stage II sporulation protein P [Ureibacillus sp. GCM10028918]
MIFDIHRDDSPRQDSTIVLNGKEYARVPLYLSKSSIKKD